MEKNPNNGITIKNEISLTFDKKGNGAYIPAIRMILLFLGVSSTVLCVRSCLQGKTDIALAFVLTASVSVILPLLSKLKRAKKWIYPILGLLFAGFVIYNGEKLVRGLKFVTMKCVEGFRDFYSFNIELKNVKAGEEARTVLLVTAVLFLAAVIFASMEVKSLHFCGILIPAVPIVMFVLSGASTDVKALLSFASYVTAFLVFVRSDGDTDANEPEGGYDNFCNLVRSKSALLCLAIVVGSAILVAIVFQKEKYESGGGVKKLQIEVSQAISGIAEDGLFEFIETSTLESRAGLAEGRLSIAPKVTYLDEELFECALPDMGSNVYIRTFAGDEYLGDRWKDNCGDVDEDELSWPCTASSANELSEEEKEYYLAVPKNFEELKELFAGEDDRVKAIDEVRELLEDLATYSLEPGALPEGKDYIKYFLFENRKGYCAHFASSAVMLLRTAGIPARYVEGYMVPSYQIRDGEITDIKSSDYLSESLSQFEGECDYRRVTLMDRNVHAWAEVYVDGFGWLVAEVTPGYVTEDRSFEKKEEAVVAEALEKKEAETGAEGSEAEEKQKEEKISKEDAEKQKSETTNRSSIGSVIVRVFSIVIGIVIFVFVCLLAWRGKRKKDKESFSLSEKILDAYARVDYIVKAGTEQGQEATGKEYVEETEKLLSDEYGITGFAQIHEIALRARFSRNAAGADLKKMEGYLGKLEKAYIAKLSLCKRVIYKLYIQSR